MGPFWLSDVRGDVVDSFCGIIFHLSSNGVRASLDTTVNLKRAIVVGFGPGLSAWPVHQFIDRAL